MKAPPVPRRLGPVVLTACLLLAMGQFAKTADGHAQSPPQTVDGGFAGAYLGTNLRLDLLESEQQVSGTLTIRETVCAVRGRCNVGSLSGEFQVEAAWLPFQAKLDGDVLVLESGGAVHRLTRLQESRANPLSDPSLSQGADDNPLADPSLTSARQEQAARQIPVALPAAASPVAMQQVTHPSGITMRCPADWSVKLDEESAFLFPPATPTAGVWFQLSSDEWDPSDSFHDPVTIAELHEEARDEGLQFRGQQIMNTPQGEVLRLKLEGLDDHGNPLRVHVLTRVHGERCILLATFGPKGAVAAKDVLSEELFQTASLTAQEQPTTGPAAWEQPASLGQPVQGAWGGPATATQVIEPPGAGYRLGCPTDWSVVQNGSLVMLIPPPAPGQGQTPDNYSASTMPWAAGSVEDPAVAQQAVAMFLQSMPGLSLTAPIERTSSAPGSGVLARLSGVNGGQQVGVHLYLKSSDQILMTLMGVGDPTALERRTAEVRQVVATLIATGPPPTLVPPSMQAMSPAPPGYGMNAGGQPLGWQAGYPYAQQAANLDPNLVGVWVTESAMSSAPQWNDMDSGGTSFATQLVYTFGADGAYSLSSQMAGGNMDVSYDGGAQVYSSGSWSVAVGQDGQAYLVLNDMQNSRQSQITYLWHQGQLVTGEQGNRTFWARVQ